MGEHALCSTGHSLVKEYNSLIPLVTFQIYPFKIPLVIHFGKELEYSYIKLNRWRRNDYSYIANQNYRKHDVGHYSGHHSLLSIIDSNLHQQIPEILFCILEHESIFFPEGVMSHLAETALCWFAKTPDHLPCFVLLSHPSLSE